VSTTEELVGRISSGSDLESENMAIGIRHADMWQTLLQTLALTSPTCGGLSVGIVRSRTEATVLIRPILTFGTHAKAM
jgi:hypothetical protein